MRRIGKGNKIVKNCIVWAMSAMIAVGSIAPAQVVRAEGTETQQVEQTDNTVNSYHQCDVHTDRVDGGGAPDSTDSSFHDNEAQKNAQASTEIQTMTKQADAAADAAADAKQAVADAQQAVDDAKSAATAAQTAAVTEQSAANTAEDEANKAKTAVDGLNDKAAENIDNYNTNVTTANQAAAAGTAELNNGVVIDEKQTDGTTTPNVNVADVQGYAEDQAAAAEAAKATAEKELKAALDVPAADYNDPTVKQHVDNVTAAAADAQTAADNAAAVVTAADAELKAKITEYNVSALEFGTDPYPYTAADGTVTYPGYPLTSTGENPTQADIEANKKAAQDAKAKLAADKKAIEDTNMAAAATAVNAAADAKTAAETAKDTAVDAAETAAKAVDTMNKKINGDHAGTTPEAQAGDLKTATDNCALVSDHDVTPAQKALDKSNADVDAKTADLTTAQNTEADKEAAKDAATTARQNAEAEARTSAEKAYTDELDNLNTAVTTAEQIVVNREDYYLCTICGIKCYDEYSYLAALAAKKVVIGNAKWNRQVFEYNHSSYVSDLVDSNVNVALARNSENTAASELQTAQQNVAKQQQLLDTATATRDADQDTLNAAITTRDATVAAAETSYKDQKIDELYASINAALLDQSANVNQAEYDKAANDWANGFEWSQVGTAILNGVSADNIILSKAEIRYAMDHSTEYGNGSGGSFFDIIKRSILNIINTTPVTQLTVSPKLVDGNIDKAINAAESQMTSYNEELQVVRANAARLDVQAAEKTAKTVKENQSANQITVNGIKDKIEAASSKIDTATTTYNTAKTKLDDLKASVNGKSISDVDLSALKAAIAAAQAKVDSAKDALKEAKAAAASAESFADWGDSLLVAQNSKTFGQLDTDGSIAKTNNDKFDQGNENVISRASALFTPNLNTVEVPYSIYKEYVKQMYTLYSYEDRNKADYKDSEGNTVKGGKGKGISNENSGTMPTVYWVIENGKLTGVKYLSTDAYIPDGTYFVGYTFKAEGDGYHIDGTLYDYKNPVTPTPEPTTTVTTISNAPTVLAATPAVLGARRTPEATPVADTDKAVLGAKRGAATGDDSNATGWIALMICTMGAGAAVVLGRRKEQENAQ